MWGVLWSPPRAGPFLCLDGGCVRPVQGGEDRLLPPNPSLSCPLSGPHLPRGAPGSARPSPRQQLPDLRPRPSLPHRPAAGARLRPYSGPTNRAMPGTAAPNPRKSRRRSPAGPAPRAAAAFGPRSRAGRGRCARLGSLRGKTPTPTPPPIHPLGWRTRVL